MSESTPRNVNLAKAAALALVLIMMAPAFVGSADAVLHYTSPAQDAQIPAAWGTGAPFGTWQKVVNEPATFYMHGNTGCGDNGVPALTTTCSVNSVGLPGTPPVQADWWMDTRLPFQQPPANPPTPPQEVLVSDPNGLGGPTGNSLDFDNHNCFVNNLQVLDETTITKLEVLLWAQGNRNLQDQIQVSMDVLNSDCTVKTPNAALFTLQTSALNNGQSSSYASYTATWTAPFVTPGQPYGVTMLKDERLRFSFALVSSTLDSTATFAFDGQGFESHVTLYSDSARVNEWTTDRFGDPTNHFAHTDIQHPADVNDRTVHWRATEFDTWGHTDNVPNVPVTATTPGSKCNSNGAGSGSTPDPREFPLSDCAKDNIDEQAMRIRVKDVTPGHPGFDSYVPLDLRLGLSVWDSSVGEDTSYVGCCDAAFINPMKNKAPDAAHPAYLGRTSNADRLLGLSNYEFDLVYSKDFLDGVYEIQFQEANKNWYKSIQFTVGNTGFVFAFEKDEHDLNADLTIADHRVALNEPTKYSLTVKNTGSVSDTYGLAVPVPGAGWTGTVTPNTVSLPPNGEAKVDMLVVPPSTAHAGDIKVVSVAATSTVTNTVKTLYTRTTYTADTTPQAPSLTSPQTEVNTRPKLSTVFPIVVHNGHQGDNGWVQGPVRDNYVISGTLDPGDIACPTSGFVIQIDPTFLPVYAASREAVSVRVQVPAEAPPGCSWTMNFQACRNLSTSTDALCSALLKIPLHIYAIDDVRLTVLKPQIDMRDTELDRYHNQCVNGPPPSCAYTVDVQDNYFDEGALFRFLVENKGDRPDSIELSGSWASFALSPADGGQHAGAQDCTDEGVNGADGVPDGWRYRLLPGSAAVPPFGQPVDPGMTYPQPLNAGPAVAARFTPEPSNPYDGQPQNVAVMPATAPQYGAGHDSTFSGEARFGRLTLPAHTSQYVFLDMFWDQDTASCVGEQTVNVPLFAGSPLGNSHTQNWRSAVPSRYATFRMSYRSGNDDSIRGNLEVTAHLTTSPTLQIGNTGDDATGMVHKVLMELGPGQPAEGYADINALATADQVATYNVMATNIGNEYDDLLISVDSGLNGWKHTIVLPGSAIQGTGIIPSGMVLGSLVEPTPNPSSGPGAPHATTLPRNCVITDTAQQQMTCHRMGIYDTVYFQVKAKPPTGARIGSYDDMGITVSSSRSTHIPGTAPGSVYDKINVRSFVQGIFGFALLHPNDNLLGYRGQTIAFPFTIKNVGTTNDVYNVAVAAADAAYYGIWNPKTSSDTLVAVPAGYEYHGFVSVTVPTNPTDSPISDPAFIQPAPVIRPLRLEIQSIQGFGQADTIDFFPTVTETPALKISAEATTIARLTEGRIRITADAPDAKTVLFNGYYNTAPNLATGVGGQPDLPTGFMFVCLPHTHPDWDVNRKCYDPYPVPTNVLTPDDTANTDGLHTLPHMVQPQVNLGGQAIQQLELFVPDKQLGISRVAHRVAGTTDTGDITYTDAIVNMGSVYGVKLTAVPCENDVGSDAANKTLPPGTPGGSANTGGTVLFCIEVSNQGLSPQSVLLSNSELPTGWEIFYDQASVTVQPPGYALARGVSDCPLVGQQSCIPLDAQTSYIVHVGLVAPAGAESGAFAPVLIFGTVQEDTTQVAQQRITAVVGTYDMKVTSALATEWVAPQEFARFPLSVENKGNLPDVVQIQAVLPSSVSDTFPTSWRNCDNADPSLSNLPIAPAGSTPSCYVILQPKEKRTDIGLDILTPSQVAPTGAGPGYTATISAHSIFNPAATDVTATTVKILDYFMADIDGDRLAEYAIDSCTVSQQDGCRPNSSDGFETFRENLQTAGVISQDLRGRPELQSFLSPDGFAQWTDPSPPHDLLYYVDINNDKKVDHLIDTDGDGLPDVYWVPGVRFGKLDFTRDVTADSLPDYFVDLEGDNRWDMVYDLALGRSFPLIQGFIDGDGYPDYVVDVNRNGLIDLNETVLLGAPNGQIRQIEYSADVNDDGLPDKAIDTNGDGEPDFFIPGTRDGTVPAAIPIILKDVTGDGVLDWTYDSTGHNGRADSYYDPICKCAHPIDTRGEFLRDLATYWPVWVLFFVGIVLFVVLVVVTRKR
ncbi:MAG: hypothetical protein V4510_11015 [bacterium]